MIDAKTDYLALPLPSPKNDLREDCPRLKEALVIVDAHAKTQDGRLDEVETRAGNLEQRATDVEGWAGTLESRTDALEGRATATEQAQAATEQELAAAVEAQRAALAAHDESPACHDSLVKRITVGSLSPVVGLVCVEDGGGSGLWFNCDAEGQPVTPPKSYWDYHPVYNALRRVLVDNQVMVEHTKFYYRAFTIPSGPFQGRKARVISPDKLDGFKPYPTFLRNGQEIDHWYCGAFAGTNEGGNPVKIGSRPGKLPIVSLNFSTMQQYCANRNTGGVEGFRMWDYYHAGELQLLSMLESCTSDSQAAYGRGRVDTDSAANVDATDVATASWRGHIGLWGNVWQMVDGIDVTAAGKLRLFRNDGSRQWVETDFV